MVMCTELATPLFLKMFSQVSSKTSKSETNSMNQKRSSVVCFIARLEYVCPLFYLFPMVNGLCVLSSQIFVAGRLGNLSSSFLLIFLERVRNLIAVGGISRPEFVTIEHKVHLKHPSRPLCFCPPFLGKNSVKTTLFTGPERPLLIL